MMDYFWLWWFVLMFLGFVGLIIWAVESFEHWFEDYWDREVRRRKARERYENIIKSKET